MIRKQVNRWLEYLFRLYKDSKETGNHVTEYFKQQALLIGLTVDEVELLKMASPMHAIGKVAIPDHVLLKPGKLNAEEWEIMKSHAVIGYELLRIQIDRFFRQLQLLPGSIMKNGMVVDTLMVVLEKISISMGELRQLPMFLMPWVVKGCIKKPGHWIKFLI